MSDVTRILSAMENGDSTAAEKLLPMVYEELRRLAAARIAMEKPGQTLQATALVHEAYLRLIDSNEAQNWHGRRHFFGAAAEAMRRILIENYRRRKSEKHGGQFAREDFPVEEIAGRSGRGDLLDLNDALDELAKTDPDAAELVKLRFFAGLTIPQVAELLGVSPRSADFLWAFARSWLKRHLRND